jgi:hypothetical protein
MLKLKKIVWALSAAALLAAPACSSSPKNHSEPRTGNELGDRGQEPKTGGDAAIAVGWKTAVNPKKLSTNVDKGLKWLAAHQLDSGAWGQGDEAETMGHGMDNLRATPSVADTSMALLAFLRAGHTAGKGEYKEQMRRGFDFVLGEIEAADSDSLLVTQTKGTRVQMKIGTYVDTFAALMVMTEAKGTLADAAANKRLDKAIAKVLAKIQKNQREDGSWDNQGWAPVLTQAMAGKGLNRAEQNGEQVDDKVLARIEENNTKQFDAATGRFATGSTAGVGLYGGAAGASSARDSANTRVAKEKDLKKKIAVAKAPEEKARYQAELDAGVRAQRQAESAEKAILTQVDDDAFIRGFGSNGGEEFLSYMLIAESLVVKGGADWEKFDVSITALVNQVQNEDGSWTGHHCITGRTFCTAAALLVLMADRAPVPIAAQLKGARG